MVSYTVTAQLVKATATITYNGTSQVESIDEPITSTVTADTLTVAKQNARREINIKTGQLLHAKIADATRMLSNSYKGRISTDYSLWQSVNITSVIINP